MTYERQAVDKGQLAVSWVNGKIFNYDEIFR